MRVVVAAVGRLKEGPERELAARFLKRAADVGRTMGIRQIELVEVKQSRARDIERRITEETIALASIVPEGAALVVLDERGQNLTSASFADQLQTWRDTGTKEATFVIGGADGVASSLHARADLCLAFGIATWPHQLLRIMLLEQLYRAMTMLAGHPYHRA